MRFAGLTIQASARLASAVRTPRLSTAWATVRTMMSEHVRRKAGQREKVAPRRRSRVNITKANVIGPVLSDVLAGFEVRGDG